MSKKILWKDAFQAITSSLGRFIAIFLLMMLGSFTLIGLKITGPDMRETATDFYRQHKLADTTVVSNYGLDSNDVRVIKDYSKIKNYDLGYFQDTRVNNGQTVVRVFSNPKNISTYELVSGKIPHKNNEIALSYLLKGKYKIGQTISLDKNTSLKHEKFRITGFVRSSEYLDKNDLGQTNVGTGQLNGVAVVAKKAFKTKVYTIARIRYKNTANMNPYSAQYRNTVEKYQKTIKDRLDKNSQNKLNKYQNEIKQARNQIMQGKEQINQVKLFSSARASQLEKEISQKEIELNKEEQSIKQLGYPTYNVHSRDYNPGYTLYRSNSERIDILANIFPVILFAIAALVCLTTMTRFVDEERINIGTLKALGYSDSDVKKKFVLYSLVSGILGILLGATLGYTFLPRLIYKAYTTNLTMPEVKLQFSWIYLLVTLAIGLLCTTFAALWALRRTLNEKPAKLLLPKAPKKGARILLERITPLWNRMSFTYKVTARNLFRYKSRMLMTIFGVAGCTGLLVMGFGIKDSLNGISEIQYKNIIKYDLVAVQRDNLTKKQQIKLDEILNSDEIKQYKDIHYEQLTKKAGVDDTEQMISLLVPSSNRNLSKFIGLHERKTNKELKLTDNSVIISEKLANLLDAKKNSTITLKDDEGKWHKFKVTDITEMYMGHYMFVGKQAYQRSMDKKYTTNGELVTLRNKSNKNVQEMSERFIETDVISVVSQNINNKKTIDNVMNGLGRVIFILIGIAVILAVVVIYNLTNINVSERIRELSTIKVLGFYDKEVTMYIYRETIILSFIGILFGYLLGEWLHNFIIISLPPTNAMFDPNMYTMNYILSGAIPLIVTLILAFVMHRRIRSIDMLEALKSVD